MTRTFFWLQLLLRVNIFFPNTPGSFIAWTTDWEIYRTKLLTTPPRHLCQGTGDVPEIQGMLQRRIHPTMSCPKPPFVSQPSNTSGTCWTHRQPQGKADNPNWSCWAALWPWNILLFSDTHWLALKKNYLYKQGCAPSPCSHHVLCYQRDQTALSVRTAMGELPLTSSQCSLALQLASLTLTLEPAAAFQLFYWFSRVLAEMGDSSCPLERPDCCQLQLGGEEKRQLNPPP